MNESRTLAPLSREDIGNAFLEHGAFIGRVVLRLMGDGPHVDDLVQETFIVAYKQREKFEGRSSLRTWLYGIASNLCLRQRRTLKRFSNFKLRLQEEAPPPSIEPDATLEQKQDIARVHRALTQLNFKQREVFVLFELEELEGKEIAAMLDIAEGTVWTRLHKARKVFEVAMRRQSKKEGAA